jgi:hypothetical protein
MSRGAVSAAVLTPYRVPSHYTKTATTTTESTRQIGSANHAVNPTTMATAAIRAANFLELNRFPRFIGLFSPTGCGYRQVGNKL